MVKMEIIEKYIDYWVIILSIFELVICPIISLIVGNTTLFLVIWISSFGLWYPTIKIIDNILKKKEDK
jgi:hypothetical protein